MWMNFKRFGVFGIGSEEQINLTVLEGRFDWRQIVGVRNMLFGAIWC